jgi:hypothetical protein
METIGEFSRRENMRWLHRVILCIGVVALLPLGLLWAGGNPQEAAKPQVATDPQTGRAIGAKEMPPDELRKLIDQKAKMIIIDVRDETQFQKETIKGAIHVPYAELPARLKEIPKDTILVFT